MLKGLLRSICEALLRGLQTWSFSDGREMGDNSPAFCTVIYTSAESVESDYKMIVNYRVSTLCLHKMPSKENAGPC